MLQLVVDITYSQAQYYSLRRIMKGGEAVYKLKHIGHQAMKLVPIPDDNEPCPVERMIVSAIRHYLR